MKRLIILALTASVLAACDSAPAPVPVPSSDVDCGTFDLKQGEQLPESAARCLVGADRTTRLRVTRRTTEGDPVMVAYLAYGDGRVQVVTDSRQDAFGEKAVKTSTCTGPAVTADGVDFASCSEPS